MMPVSGMCSVPQLSQFLGNELNIEKETSIKSLMVPCYWTKLIPDVSKSNL